MNRLTRGLALMLALQGTLAWSADTLLEFPAGLNQNLVLESTGQYSARVPAQLAASAPADAASVRARVFDVVVKEGRGAEMAREFETKFVPAGASHGHALVVSLKQPARVPPGSYAISVLLDTEPAVKGLVQTAVFTLQRPAAQLAAQPGSVVLVQDQLCVLSCDNLPARLQLEEQGRRADAAGLSWRDLRDGSPPPDSGRLTVTPTPSRVASAPVALEIAASGAYPLGSTKGKVEFRSDDLAAPLAVGYEVRARLAREWIVFLALVGAMAGWAVRIVLAGETALRTAALSASESLEALATQRAASDDAEFRAQLDKLEARLRLAMEDRGRTRVDRAKAITDEAKKVLDELKTQRDALDAAVAEQRKRATPWHELLGIDWVVPEQVAIALRNARDALAEAQRRTARHDAAGARDLLDGCMAGPFALLHTEALADGAALVEALCGWCALGPPLPEAAQQQLRGRADAAKAQFPSPPEVVKAAAVDPLRDVLRRLDQLFHHASFAADQLAETTRRFVDDVLRELVPPDDQVEAYRQRMLEPALTQARVAVGTVTKPRQALHVLSAGVDRLREVWNTVLIEQLSTSQRTKVEPEIKQAIATASWAKAVDAAVKARSATTLSGEALAVAAVQPMSGRREALPSAGERVPSILAAAAGIEVMPRLAGTVAERVLLAAQLHWLSFVQSLFFGALFVAAVWVLHADAWVGTPKEMLTILLMAFGFDWTSESLLSATKKLKPD